ncbi:MAG TPA: hypothetical protein VGB71_06900, partial [Flavisolibacter sp.]
MKITRRYLGLLVPLLCFSLLVCAGDFIRTADGIIVRPDAPFAGNAKEVQLHVISDGVIRVTAIADKNLSP